MWGVPTRALAMIGPFLRKAKRLEDGKPEMRAIMTETTLPTVRLRPKAEARAIRHGFPWVYADELVTDRRTMTLAAGSIVMLEDAERRALGVATINPKSKIIVRVLDRNEGADIGKDWLATKLRRGLKLRERVYDEAFYRMVHGEAGGLPGVVIDRY